MGYIFDALKKSPEQSKGNTPTTRPETRVPQAPAAPPAADALEIEGDFAAAEQATDAVAEAADELAKSQAELVAGINQARQAMAAESAESAEHDAPSLQMTHPAPSAKAKAQATATTGADDAAPRGTAPGHRVELNVSLIDERLVSLVAPASIVAEEYRAIRTSVLARWQQKRNLIHTITSSLPQEGKTITSLNLSGSFAELRNRRVLVVEADLRAPQFTRLLGLPASPGLVGVLENSASLDSAILTVGRNDLYVLPAGRSANNEAVQLLSGQNMVSLVRELAKSFDHVIIDTPPVLDLADAGILGSISDEVLLVARLRYTPQPLIEQAMRILASYNAPVAGIVGTDQKPKGNGYYQYGERGRYRRRRAA